MKIRPEESRNWQAERCKILQRVCRRIERAVESGQPVQKTISRIARQSNGRPYRCLPARTLQLSAKSLRRFWDTWRSNGEQPAVFQLNYYRKPSAMSAAVLIQFMEFCAASRFRSMRAAWREFLASGHGSQLKGMTLTYDMPCHHFPARNFYHLRDGLDGIAAAKRGLSRLRSKLAAEIRERLPDRPLPSNAKGESGHQG